MSLFLPCERITVSFFLQAVMDNTIGISTTLQNNASIEVTALQGIDFAIIDSEPYGMTHNEILFTILPHLGR